MKKTIVTALLLLMCTATFGAESVARKPTKEFRKYHRIVAKYITKQPDSFEPLVWELNKCDAEKLRKLERAVIRDERLAIMYRVFVHKENGTFILRPAPINNPRFLIKIPLPLIPKLVVIDGKVRDIDLVGFNIKRAGFSEWSKILNIPQDDIESIELSPNSNENIIKIFGEKARDGVLFVTTKNGGKKNCGSVKVKPRQP